MKAEGADSIDVNFTMLDCCLLRSTRTIFTSKMPKSFVLKSSETLGPSPSTMARLFLRISSDRTTSAKLFFNKPCTSALLTNLQTLFSTLSAGHL